VGMTRPGGPKVKRAGAGKKIKEKGKTGRGAAGLASDYGLN
jgi:hypothetical protein